MGSSQNNSLLVEGGASGTCVTNYSSQITNEFSNIVDDTNKKLQDSLRSVRAIKR